jgi:hypothetical protein
MKRIYIPTSGPSDWQKLLAAPEKHWRTGYSAKTLAACWEDAAGSFPPEIINLFHSASRCVFDEVELLVAFPEWKVYLPPTQGHPSQNDLFVLGKDKQGNLVSIMIEGKVSETFGDQVVNWFKDETPGKKKRIDFIQSKLGINGKLMENIRYQLLHRTVSAVMEAERFRAKSAVMIVHSFSQEDQWFDDYAAFLGLFVIKNPQIGQMYFLRENNGVSLYSGWARGDARFLQV